MLFHQALFDFCWMSLTLSTFAHALSVQRDFPLERSFTNAAGQNCSYVDRDPSWGYKCDDHPDFPGPTLSTLFDAQATQDLAIENRQAAAAWLTLLFTGLSFAPSGQSARYAKMSYEIQKKFYEEEYAAIFNPEAVGGRFSHQCVSNYAIEKKFQKNGEDHWLFGCLAKAAEQKSMCEPALKKSDEMLAIHAVEKWVHEHKPNARAICVQLELTPVRNGEEGPRNAVSIRGKFAVSKNGLDHHPCSWTCNQYQDIPM